MKIQLKHADLPTAVVQWDKEKGTLLGDSELIAQAKTIADMAIQDGFIAHIIPCVDFPISDPLKNAEELALVFAFLGYRSPQLPIPELNEDHADLVVY